MKILLRDYSVVRSCTNKNCNNYRSGSLLNNFKPEVVDVMDVFGEPEQCDRCGVGALVVKRASFALEKSKFAPTSREFRYMIKCNKCNISWTTTRLTPLTLNDVGTLEFLKSSSVDGLKCRGCKSNENMVLLQASEL